MISPTEKHIEIREMVTRCYKVPTMWCSSLFEILDQYFGSIQKSLSEISKAEDRIKMNDNKVVHPQHLYIEKRLLDKVRNESFSGYASQLI